MAIVIMIPVVFFSLFGLDMLLNRERESRLRVVQETARATALAIDQEIAQAQGALTVFANSTFLKTDDFAGLYRLMVAGRASKSSWNIVYDDQGRQVLNTVLPQGAPLPVTAYAWTAPVIDNQKLHVSNLRIGAINKVAGINVNVPTPTATGKRYVVSQVFMADHLSELLASRSISPAWVVGLFGSDGISIARNTNARALIGKPVRPELYQASLKSFSGQMRHVTRENIAVYSVYTHTDRTGWTLTIGVPEEEIEAPARRAAWYAAVAMGLTFALATGIALFMARRLTRAMDDAVGAARILGQGDTPGAKVSGVSEINVLQAALHEAGAALALENASRPGSRARGAAAERATSQKAGRRPEHGQG